MPSNVAWFERLMFLDVALSAVATILQFPGSIEGLEGVESESPVLDPAFIGTISLLILVLILILIWLTVRQRKNWARWVLLAWFVIADLSLLYDFLSDQAFRDGVFAFLLNIIMLGLEITAFYLIFTGNARDWFKTPATT